MFGKDGDSREEIKLNINKRRKEVERYKDLGIVFGKDEHIIEETKERINKGK